MRGCGGAVGDQGPLGSPWGACLPGGRGVAPMLWGGAVVSPWGGSVPIPGVTMWGWRTPPLPVPSPPLGVTPGRDL